MNRRESRASCRILCALLLCLTSTQLAAEASLQSLVQAALQRHPGSEMVQAQQGMADALQHRAEHPFAAPPRANLRYQTDQIGSDLGYREWEGGVEMPLWLPGQAGSFAREATQTRETADAYLRARTWEVSGEVRERLWTAALAASEQAQAEAARDVAKKLLLDVQRRVEAGELPRSDALLAEKDLLLREQALLQASNQATQAAGAFKHYTGFDFSAAAANEHSAQATDQLPANHPYLNWLEQQLAQARAHRDRISKNLHEGPTVWLGGKRARSTTVDAYESSVGLELSMPFGGHAHHAPELAEAEIALTQAQTESMKARLQMQEQLLQANLNLQNSATVIDKTQQRLELAEQSLRLSRRAFDLGETSLLQLLQAQADAINARNDHELSRLQHGQAIARLNQALGVLPQ